MLTDRDGSVLVYRQPGGTRTQDKTGAAAAELAYSPVGDDTALEGAKLTLAGSTTAMTLRLTEDDGTVTTWKPVGFTAGTPTVWAPAAVTEPGTVGSTSYSKDGAGRITRILAAAPPGVSCPAAGALVAGCRALNLTYATATTATPTAPGGIAGQLQQVTLEIYNPHRSGGAGMEQVVVGQLPLRQHQTAGVGHRPAAAQRRGDRAGSDHQLRLRRHQHPAGHADPTRPGGVAPEL